jgi:hypothetical protein
MFDVLTLFQPHQLYSIKWDDDYEWRIQKNVEDCIRQYTAFAQRDNGKLFETSVRKASLWGDTLAQGIQDIKQECWMLCSNAL